MDTLKVIRSAITTEIITVPDIIDAKPEREERVSTRPDLRAGAHIRLCKELVYLVDKRIDMLPALLGTNLCSLRPHVERLAFSVIWVWYP